MHSTDSYHAQIFRTPLLLEENRDATSRADVVEPGALEVPPTDPTQYGFSCLRLPLLRRVIELQARLFSTPADTMSAQERVQFGADLLGSDRALLSEIHTNDRLPPSKHHISKAANLAALIYSNILLRDISASSRTLQSLCIQLRSVLTAAASCSRELSQMVNHPQPWESNPRAYSWPLLVGAFCSNRDSEHRPWFMNCLRSAYTQGTTGLPKWEEVRMAINSRDEDRWVTESSRVREILDIKRYYPWD